MTVGELIEELRKFPEHHVVIVQYTDDAWSIPGSACNSEESIFDVQAGGQGLVVLDCTDRS